MKISRREVIIGAAAGVAVVATGAPVLAAPIAESVISSHPVMQNVKRAVFGMNPPMQAPLAAMIISLNARLLDRHGDELFGDRYISGPVDEVNGVVLEAKTRKLVVRWEFEAAVDGIAVGGKEAEETIFNKLVDDIASEYRHEIARNPGVEVYPYVPIMSSGVLIDSTSFQPVMSFMTRYATA